MSDATRVRSKSGLPAVCPPPSAAFRAEVDDPVGFGHHVEVVLDHHHRVAAVDQAVQHADQLFDVGHVQADRRLVEDVERVLPHAAAGFGRRRRGAPWPARSPA
jgi:hypothetical protein